MIKLLTMLFIQFFHIGVFSFGGGYATMPFLYDIADKFHWYSTSQLTDMVAVSSITPGPVGVNMATFAGFATSGILGALVATTAIMLPSFIFVSIVFKILKKFETNPYVQSILKALKPAGCALLCAVGIKLIFTSNLHLLGGLCLVAVLIAGCIKKLDPLIILGVTALYGLIIGALNWIGV
ncbi:MAG TPA: chromate transporter [Cyanobacteria bacterium UBA11991]|nr:chromate transporter [Cyanobacteriota bacterium]MDY6359202.1 chromate transporter [Cyanobacteriota bacterium]MDY6364667.1 chromate transporter [Cyanobacteriota bacterium]MDY6383734.1 chromate transporter [Cyanobacteriota bacterium]HCB10896.1 chromate transporter [Cyanobacteria bacterium UBA11991]